MTAAGKSGRFGSLRAAVKPIRAPVCGARLDSAARHGGFEQMRQNEEEHGAESYPDELRQRGRFVRRGRVDGWRDEMSAATADRVVSEFADVMCSMGYKA